MKRALVYGLVVVLFGSVSGCSGDDPEALIKQSIADMNALSTALEKKESPEKLKAAAEKLKATMDKLEKVKVPKETKEQLEKKYEKELIEAVFKMIGAAAANPEGAKSIEDTMKSLGGKKNTESAPK